MRCGERSVALATGPSVKLNLFQRLLMNDNRKAELHQNPRDRIDYIALKPHLLLPGSLGLIDTRTARQLS